MMEQYTNPEQGIKKYTYKFPLTSILLAISLGTLTGLWTAGFKITIIHYMIIGSLVGVVSYFLEKKIKWKKSQIIFRLKQIVLILSAIVVLVFLMIIFLIYMELI